MARRNRKGSSGVIEFLISILSIVCIICILISKNTSATNKDYSNTTNLSNTSTEDQIIDDDTTEADDYDGVYSESYLNQSYCDRYWDMNEDEQELYNALYSASYYGETTATIDTDTFNSIEEPFDIYTSFLYDHPELFWLKRQYTYSSSSEETVIEMKTKDFWKYVSNKEKYINDLDAIVTQVANEALQYNSKYDQIKYVHDYIVNNTKYDHKAADDINKTISNKRTEIANTPYGPLVTGTGVCGGYSRSFQMIMQRMGYECGFVCGNTYLDDGSFYGYHAWNYLKVDGDYYYMDVTWDDPTSSKPDEDLLTYDYYCITSDLISKNHSVDEWDAHAPTAYGTKYAYRG